MAECEAELRLHDFSDGSMAYLTCDLDLSEHAGLNHHDGIYGIWWSACTLEEHGHAGAATETRTERRRAWRAGVRDDAAKIAAREGSG